MCMVQSNNNPLGVKAIKQILAKPIGSFTKEGKKSSSWPIIWVLDRSMAVEQKGDSKWVSKVISWWSLWFVDFARPRHRPVGRRRISRVIYVEGLNFQTRTDCCVTILIMYSCFWISSMIQEWSCFDQLEFTNATCNLLMYPTLELFFYSEWQTSFGLIIGIRTSHEFLFSNRVPITGLILLLVS